MKRRLMLGIVLVVIGSIFVASAVSAQGGSDVSQGGLLYDKWWKVTGADEPTTDNPLWATQTTNTRSGDDTWRCKECHGWDYLGKDGAYASGSHYTGFPGVYQAAQDKTVAELAAALTGATNADHDFSSVLDEAAINALATFLKEGTVDARVHIDYATKTPLNADVGHGMERYDGLCAACHGADGTTLNFGSEEGPEYVSTLANDNPQEILHKIRFGQPGSSMPSTVDAGWSVQDAVDVLAYVQTLPTGGETVAPLPETGEETPTQLPETGGSSLPWTPLALLASGLLFLALGVALLASHTMRARQRGSQH
jgi:cytochrome c553